MKPILSKTQDSDALQTLGRASLQIVHDLKNQLNGLKLYATFLRRRFEKKELLNDEKETLDRLSAGLDRAAEDLATLMHYGQPVQPKQQPEVDLQRLISGVLSSLPNGSDGGALNRSIETEAAVSSFAGDFDPVLLAEALKSITLGALKLIQQKNGSEQIRVQLKRMASAGQATAVVEWQGLNLLDHDPFRSFAGSEGIKMSLAAKIVEAHGGSAGLSDLGLRVTLPLK